MMFSIISNNDANGIRYLDWSKIKIILPEYPFVALFAFAATVQEIKEAKALDKILYELEEFKNRYYVSTFSAKIYIYVLFKTREEISFFRLFYV